jgi:hypothetical protein
MLDSQQEKDDEKNLIHKYIDEQDKISLLDEKLKFAGRFVILSSQKYALEEILPLYYMRQNIEQVFDLSKNVAGLTPARGHSVETLRGKFLISFISTILASFILNKIGKLKLSLNTLFLNISNLHINIY